MLKEQVSDFPILMLYLILKQQLICTYEFIVLCLRKRCMMLLNRFGGVSLTQTLDIAHCVG